MLTAASIIKRLQTAVQLIDPITEEDCQRICSDLESVLQTTKKPQKVGSPTSYGGQIYTWGDNNNGWYVLANPDDLTVHYFVKYAKVKTMGAFAGRQVMVYRKTDSTINQDIAKTIFNKYLLPRFGSLTTDTQQTILARRFWLTRAEEALALGNFVYFYDKSTTPITKTHVENQQDLVAIIPKAWGKLPKDRMVGLVISNKEL